MLLRCLRLLPSVGRGKGKYTPICASLVSLVYKGRDLARVRMRLSKAGASRCAGVRKKSMRSEGEASLGSPPAVRRSSVSERNHCPGFLSRYRANWLKSRKRGSSASTPTKKSSRSRLPRAGRLASTSTSGRSNLRFFCVDELAASEFECDSPTGNFVRRGRGNFGVSGAGRGADVGLACPCSPLMLARGIAWA